MSEEERKRFTARVKAGAGIYELGEEFGRTDRSVNQWIVRLGLRKPKSNAVDYTEADIFLRDGRLEGPGIAAQTGSTVRQVHHRRYALGLSKHRTEEQLHNEQGHEPFIPYQDRPLLAAKAKAASLGMDWQTFERVWLPGKKFSLTTGFNGRM